MRVSGLHSFFSYIYSFLNMDRESSLASLSCLGSLNLRSGNKRATDKASHYLSPFYFGDFKRFFFFQIRFCLKSFFSGGSRRIRHFAVPPSNI